MGSRIPDSILLSLESYTVFLINTSSLVLKYKNQHHIECMGGHLQFSVIVHNHTKKHIQNLGMSME